MSAVQGTVTGTHPLGEPLIQSILDYKYGRAGNQPVIEKFDLELSSFINLQEALGFTHLSSGNLGIEDLIRPFTRSLSALKSYEQLGDLPITRFHYTNTFFRQPTVVEKLAEVDNVFLRDINTITHKNSYSLDAIAGKPGKFITVGPYSFAKMVRLEDQSPYADLSDLILDAAVLLANELNQLDNISLIQLDDPYLVWERVPRSLREVIKEAYQIIKRRVSADIIVQTYFDSAKNIMSLLVELPTAGFGIDFYQTNLLALKDIDLSGKILQAGLVDSQNYIPDQEGQLDTSDTDFLVKIAETLLELDPKSLHIGTTTSLEYVPRNIADQKLKQVQRIVELTEESQ